MGSVSFPRDKASNYPEGHRSIARDGNRNKELTNTHIEKTYEDNSNFDSNTSSIVKYWIEHKALQFHQALNGNQNIGKLANYSLDKAAQRNSLSKLGAVSVQSKGKSGAKQVGHTLGEVLLSKVYANWLDEI
eukprot:3872909-Heterocapsa_arctica.AAC.1